jgi:hypothetical protein
MRVSQEELRHEIQLRIAECLEGFPISANVSSALASAIWEQAIIIEPWSVNQLLSISPQKDKPLNLDQKQKPPFVVYYQPKKAFALLVAVLTGVVGASSGLLIGLTVISAILAITDIRTAPSSAECLLLSILLEEQSQSLARAELKNRFVNSATNSGAATPEDFEIALHSVVQLGVIRMNSGNVEVADKLIMHFR